MRRFLSSDGQTFAELVYARIGLLIKIRVFDFISVLEDGTYLESANVQQPRPPADPRVARRFHLLGVPKGQQKNNLPQSRLSLRESTYFRGAKGDTYLSSAPKATVAEVYRRHREAVDDRYGSGDSCCQRGETIELAAVAPELDRQEGQQHFVAAESFQHEQPPGDRLQCRVAATQLVIAIPAGSNKRFQTHVMFVILLFQAFVAQGQSAVSHER